LKEGEVYTTRDGQGQLRIEKILEVFQPFGLQDVLPKAKIIVTVLEKKK
jgi:hypothetical protein